MSITAYVGLPGSGKSYGVFQNVIIPALSQGREVWTNIPFNESAVLDRFGYQPIFFDVEDVKDNDDWFDQVFTSGAVLVIDELWRLWPSGLRANQIKEQHKSFLAEHRHRVGQNGLATEVVFVTQDLSQIAAFARALVETTFRSVNLDYVGQKERFRIDIYQGAVTGPKPPERSRIRQTFGKYSAEVFSLYKSHTMSETGEAGEETKVDGRANILKSGKVLMMPIGIVFSVVMVLFSIGAFRAFFGSSDAEASAVVSAPAVPQTVQRTVTTVTEKKVLDVLANRTLSIVMNRGRYPNIDYVIRAESGQNHFTVSLKEMLKLGYQVQPIGDCLVNITVNAKDYLVTCERPQDDRGLFDFKVSSGAGEA